jgi:hypothetical protein
MTKVTAAVILDLLFLLEFSDHGVDGLATVSRLNINVKT